MLASTKSGLSTKCPIPVCRTDFLGSVDAISSAEAMLDMAAFLDIAAARGRAAFPTLQQYRFLLQCSSSDSFRNVKMFVTVLDIRDRFRNCSTCRNCNFENCHSVLTFVIVLTIAVVPDET